MSALLLGPALALAIGGTATPGEYLVQLRADVKAATVVGDYGGTVLRQLAHPGLALVRLAGGDGKAKERTLAALQADGRVEGIEPNWAVTLDPEPDDTDDPVDRAAARLKAAAPDDPQFFRQYALDNHGQTRGTPGADVGALEAWSRTHGSRDVKVGVIDTGIDGTHPDLAANIWTNAGESGLDDLGRDKAGNGVDDDGNGYVDDVHGWNSVAGSGDASDDQGHGTHAAGVIGAVTGNALGIAGLNWQVSLVAVKFLDRNGSGTLATLVEALDYATAIGAHVTSNGYSFTESSPLLAAAIERAAAAGTVIVASSGMGGDGTASAVFPADYASASIAAVTASDHADRVPNWARIGYYTHLAAPGVKVYSTLPGGAYGYRSGVSQAAPFVAGAAALLRAEGPTLSAPEVVRRLTLSSRQISGLASPADGRLDIGNAMVPDAIPPSAVPNFRVTARTREGMTIAWDAAGDDGTSGLAVKYEIRYSFSPIESETDWQNATNIDWLGGGLPDPDDVIIGTSTSAGSSTGTEIGSDPARPDRPQPSRGRPSGFADEPALERTFRGFNPNTTVYLAIRAQDDYRNIGELGPSLLGTTATMTKIAEFTGDSLEGLTVVGGWGVEPVDNYPFPGNNTGETVPMLSDSPGSRYPELSDVSLTTPAIPLPEGTTALQLRMVQKYELETDFDFAIVEASADAGASWTELRRETGWTHFDLTVIEVPRELLASGTIMVRFRLLTDGGGERDGWYLREIQLWNEGSAQ